MKRALIERLPARLARAFGDHASCGATTVSYRYAHDAEPPAGVLTVYVAAAREQRADRIVTWLGAQTLSELRVVARAPDGAEQVHAAGEWARSHPAGPFFAAPGTLPALSPAHYECCLLVIAAERVDAVALLDQAELEALGADGEASEVWQGRLRHRAVFDRAAFDWDPLADAVRPLRAHLLVKVACTTHQPESTAGATRQRGPYRATRALAGTLTVELRDAGRLARRPRERTAGDGAVPVLVTTSFLARGGAEHTLYETLLRLRGRFEVAIATLAPHAPRLGDRRADFRAVTERILPLGDLVHPAAMPGMLRALLDSLGARILYNANGTTLFYEFAPALKRERPDLRIVDHLYDHRVGYVERYRDPALRGVVDACVAENRRVATALAGLGWEPDRVPVIWPCGRPAAALPSPDERAAIRRRLRGALGLDERDVVFLTAARMHEQKRPLDLVAVARALAGSPAFFLLVGGGPLEQAVDAAIAAAPQARIRRLPFRDDVPELIAASDAGCLVSDFEGLPVFLIECLQQGVPFLGTSVGDMGELLAETGAGVVVERPGDLGAIAAAARALCDRERRAPLARNARQAAARFDLEACAEQYARAILGTRP